MPDRLKSVIERTASLEMDVKNFREETIRRLESGWAQTEQGFKSLSDRLDDLRDNHLHALEERVDGHQKLLYGTVLGVLANIVVSLLMKK